MNVIDFTCQTQNASEFSLAQLRGRTVVLYFYPRDDTPGCTLEAQDFSAKIKRFEEQQVTVLGISRDTVTAHAKFCTKYQLAFDLLADPEERICNQFQVMKDKNMYGKKVRGIERSTFVIDAQGRIEKEWRKVKVEGHVDEVLHYLQHRGQ